MGAGIGAIFRAPLGGAVLAVEIPYREDVEADALVPAFVGSIVAFSIFGAIVGFAPIFGRVAGAGFTDPRQLVYYSLIGLACRRRRPAVHRRLLRHDAAGSAAGRIPRDAPTGRRRACGRLSSASSSRACSAPATAGSRPGSTGTTLLGLPLWVVLVLPFAKILATSLSIGSGGSGGIFGPGMVIGGLLGAGIWRLLEPIAPGVPVGSVAVRHRGDDGALRQRRPAPLAVMLMVAEMTDSLAMLGPAMLAIGIATLVVGDRSIYASQLRSRAESPAHRFRFALPLMAAIPAGDAARAPRAVARAGRVGGRRAYARLEAAGVPGAPVVDRDGSVRGSVDLADAGGGGRSGATVGDLALSGPSSRPTTRSTTSSDSSPTSTGRGPRSSPTTGSSGILSARDVVSAYRRALAANVRQVRSVGLDRRARRSRDRPGIGPRGKTGRGGRLAAGQRPRLDRARRPTSSCRAATSCSSPATG